MYPPLQSKCLHTWNYREDSNGWYFACEDCARILPREATLSESMHATKVRGEIRNEILQLFDSRGMIGAKHFKEEIETLVNTIVSSHEDLE